MACSELLAAGAELVVAYIEIGVSFDKEWLAFCFGNVAFIELLDTGAELMVAYADLDMQDMEIQAIKPCEYNFVELS